MSEPNYIHAIRFVKKSDRVRQFLIPLRQLIDPQVLVMGVKINLIKIGNRGLYLRTANHSADRWKSSLSIIDVDTLCDRIGNGWKMNTEDRLG
jgi:hypothetical protein